MRSVEIRLSLTVTQPVGFAILLQAYARNVKEMARHATSLIVYDAPIINVLMQLVFMSVLDKMVLRHCST